MKYRYTPLNIFRLVLIIYGIKLVLDPGAMGFGVVVAAAAFLVVFVLLIADLLLQQLVSNRKKLFLGEGLLCY